MYTDETILTEGRHKRKKLIDVPKDYLICLHDNKSYFNEEIKEYIQKNIGKIRQANQSKKKKKEKEKSVNPKPIKYVGLYNDKTILTQGKYQSRKLIDVPAQYLLKLYDTRDFFNVYLMEYIVDNLDTIRKRYQAELITGPPKILPKEKSDALENTRFKGKKNHPKKSKNLSDTLICEKVKYNTIEEANEALRIINISSKRKHGIHPPVSNYYCKHCIGWHITSHKSPILKKKTRNPKRNHLYQ